MLASPRNEGFQCEDHVDQVEDEEIAELESTLADLCVEEEQLAKKKRKALLQKQIEEKRASLAAYSDAAVEGNGPATVKQLRGFTLSDVTAPLDGILNPLQPQTSQEGQTPWSMLQQSATLPSFQAPPPANASLESRASEMFLRPAQLPKGEKVLRIIDFIDTIIPREEERTISDGRNTKLIVSYGPKKPKLEQVTLPQWVISNTRIFYNLILSKELTSLEDIQNYFAYTVKIMELSTHFQWTSVLK